MRFSRIHAKHFGPHRDRDEELDPKVVLIFGRNESGKSSFRSAIETLLYGFEPATRDKHPLAQWSEGQGGDLHLEADYALDDDSAHRIERILQANAKSRTAPAGADFEGARKGNNPLSFTEGLPRALYRSIYAIETEQLAALAASEQSHVDDLLLPDVEALGLRPIGDVREALRTDLATIWRSQKRGSFRLRELDDELNAAHERVREAEDEEAALRDALREQRELEAQVTADKLERERLKKIDSDAPYLGSLFHWRQRERTHGEPIDFSALGDEFKFVDPEDVKRQADELDEDLAAPRARLQRNPFELAEAHARVLEAAAAIGLAEKAIRTHVDNRRASATGADEARQLRADAARELAGVLARPCDAPLLAELERLPIAQLESAHEEWSLGWEAHATAPPSLASRPPVWTIGLAALAAGAAIATTLPAPPAWAPPLPPWLAPAAIVVTLLAAVAAFFLRPHAEPKGDPPERPRAVDELLSAFPVATAMLASPSGLRRWIESATRARKLLGDAERAESEARRLALEGERELAAWRTTCERLAIATDGDGPVLVERMRVALERAVAEQRRVLVDSDERKTARSEIDFKQPILDRHRAQLRALGETLRRNVPGTTDLHAAYAELEQRRKQQEYVRTRRAELAEDPRWRAFRDDPRVNAEREPDDAPWVDRVSHERRSAIGARDESIETAIRRLVELGEMLGADPGSRSARARDVVANLQEALASAKVERDRLALLDSILTRAEQDFREEHQPDVLRRAGRHLERITGGRYGRLDYLEGTDGGLFVSCRERSEPVEVAAPISRGTLDQIYLCLRLGLLDHLDADRERLPLILDDALLRMDDVRRQEVYALLRELAATRQVFFLTCHRAIADEAEKALATARIELPDR